MYPVLLPCFCAHVKIEVGKGFLIVVQLVLNNVLASTPSVSEFD